MKLKKILSMILVFIISFSTATLINRCSGMKIATILPKYRCMRCGYISNISLKRSRNSRREMIYCRNCRNKEFFGKNLKFKLFNPFKIKRTSRFGICPNSQPGKIHLGYISDGRINRKYGTIPRLQLVEGTDKFEFNCYDCNKKMMISPNPKKTSAH